MDAWQIREEAVRIIGEDRVPLDVLTKLVANFGEPDFGEEPERCAMCGGHRGIEGGGGGADPCDCEEE
jgi:hypothetical protein